MNTQLQRMMVVLFLALTLISVTVLFWLPVNNDSNRILVAKENPDTEKWNLSADTETRLVNSNEAPASLDQDGNLDATSYLAQNNQELVTSDNELQQSYNPQDSDARSKKTTAQNDIRENLTGNLNSLPSSTQQSGRSAHDVMGNKRAYVTDHTVQKNDWFSSVTREYWDDLFMWPDLYTMNIDQLQTQNPDLIYPGEKITIYESLLADGEFSADDRLTLLNAYLAVYKIYKQVGESKDLAAAQLLASALRYDKKFLESHSAEIAPNDSAMAKQLLKDQKFLD